MRISDWSSDVCSSDLNVFGETLAKLAETDPRIVAITAAMPSGTGVDKFAKAHPERGFDVGIAEQHGVTFAAGLAAPGMRPFAAIHSTFLPRDHEQETGRAWGRERGGTDG